MNPKQHREKLKELLFNAAKDDLLYDDQIVTKHPIYDRVADKAIDEFIEAIVSDLTEECLKLSVKGEGEEACIEVESADLPKMYFKTEQQIDAFATHCKEMLNRK